MNFLDVDPNQTVKLKSHGGLPNQAHVFDQDSIDAVNAALAAQRPLLIRGDPGVGKSQLARAVVKGLNRIFISYVVDAHCESRDLLWHFDAVQRLADAQLGKVLGDNARTIKKKLRVDNYLHPGPLWWALSWKNAEEQARKVGQTAPVQFEDCFYEEDYVLLIDEIDKAEMDLPNGLLEVLGDGGFTPAL